MTHGKRIRFALGIGAALLGSGGLLLACGGDDTTVGIGGTDAAADGTITHTDGGDAGAFDGSPQDGSSDAANDGPVTDGGDAGDAETNTEQLQTFANNLARAYCTNLATACSTYDAGAGVDGGAVNVDYCVNEVTIRSDDPILEGSSAGIFDPTVVGHGDIAYNDTYAQKCVAEVTQLNFAAVPGADAGAAVSYAQVANDCFLAAQGTLPAGSPCYGSLECAPHNYCNIGANDAGAPADAGDAGPPPTGLCQAVLPQSGDCTANQDRGDSCSYLGSQLDKAYCDVFDLVSPTPTCQKGLIADGLDCPYNLACQSGLCGPGDALGDYLCLEQLDFRPLLCNLYPPPTP